MKIAGIALLCVVMTSVAAAGEFNTTLMRSTFKIAGDGSLCRLCRAVVLSNVYQDELAWLRPMVDRIAETVETRSTSPQR